MSERWRLEAPRAIHHHHLLRVAFLFFLFFLFSCLLFFSSSSSSSSLSSSFSFFSCCFPFSFLFLGWSSSGTGVASRLARAVSPSPPAPWTPVPPSPSRRPLWAVPSFLSPLLPHAPPWCLMILIATCQFSLPYYRGMAVFATSLLLRYMKVDGDDGAMMVALHSRYTTCAAYYAFSIDCYLQAVARLRRLLSKPRRTRCSGSGKSILITGLTDFKFCSFSCSYYAPSTALRRI